jgi:NAD(P)-dependent dehydrogenase (short-subunit alcohol dehydrogenase family)
VIGGAPMACVLVVGASRGIGLEFTRQYADAGERVVATHRASADAARLQALGARPHSLDVLDVEAIAELARRFESEPLDVAILGAGIYGPRSAGIAAPSTADFDAVMHTNVLAPMRLIAALAPALSAARGKLAVLSSRMGSTGMMAGTSGWLYRSSKAALNNVLRAASLELGPRGVVCMAFHPGWVRTDMGGTGADIDAAASVAGMRRVIAQANDSHNGKFLHYTGEQIAW